MANSKSPEIRWSYLRAQGPKNLKKGQNFKFDFQIHYEESKNRGPEVLGSTLGLKAP